MLLKECVGSAGTPSPAAFARPARALRSLRSQAGTAAAFALALAALTPPLEAAPRSNVETYELWQDCSELPDAFEFLPLYLNSETPGFVDLGWTKMLDGLGWRALQYTRDKDFGPVPVVAGRWYGGLGSDRWPIGTVNPGMQFERFRILAWEVDGVRHSIDPACVYAGESDELAFGLYNVWVRFPEPGVHTLKIIGRQVRDFYFIYPYASFGAADPLGLMGRRVFLAGETLGEDMDEEFVHVYELHVGRMN